jgi:hypothetical protein
MAAFLCMYKIEHRLQTCLRNPRIAYSSIMLVMLQRRELNLNFKIETTFKNPRYMYSSRPNQPYHFQTDLIWWDGTDP